MTDDPQSQTIAWFHSLASVLPAEMVGVWRGEGIPSGHPLDGVLENLQWVGKRFQADLRADALLFQGRPGRLVAIEPSYFPIRLALRFAPIGRTSVAKRWFSYLQKAVRARGTTAMLSLRMMDGSETAAMVYDKQPIVDYFRRVADDEVAGMMVVEGDERRYFFRLRRVDIPGQDR
ncbi:GXWXG domain-containing protein [Rhizobium sp. S152]|uniref:GXWXG domain-containing protein n=1 Tax=Rhizobium sp. S152 TaxID=3055038 RepID=UPI0025A93704|nr:GXWXG domain-containing protein [Rhizobium sp. S152]MDM9627684.1 GXWXG domain-containing protein [Rhizobium sp. S152]